MKFVHPGHVGTVLRTFVCRVQNSQRLAISFLIVSFRVVSLLPFKPHIHANFENWTVRLGGRVFETLRRKNIPNLN